MMSYSTLCFYGELIDLLSVPNSCGVISYPLTRKASIKDILESLGPPHTEIGHIQVNNRPVSFGHIPRSGQIIGLYPFVPPVDPCQASVLRPTPLPHIQFLVDVNVGKLARLLRMLGINAAFDWSWSDAYIARLAAREGRIVLSKDHGLLKRSSIQWGRLIRAQSPQAQLLEVIHFFGLKPPFALFSRCLTCNTILQSVRKEDIEHRLEPKTKRYYQRFSICPSCQRIYWPGSHHQRMLAWLRETLSLPASFPR